MPSTTRTILKKDILSELNGSCYSEVIQTKDSSIINSKLKTEAKREEIGKLNFQIGREKRLVEDLKRNVRH